MKRTEAIFNFLQSQPYDIGKLYTENMEVQVNVAQGDGEIIHGKFKGINWQGYSDGINNWKHFRIPYNANSEPTYTDTEIKFDLSKHTEAIGMTGWDWKNKKSLWIGFDFDSIISHKEGLSGEELDDIKRRLGTIPFVSLYSSTGGIGLHIYIMLNLQEVVKTHTEHAALARALLAKCSGLSGLNLEARIDALGGNMWVWHRNATKESYKLIKQGSILSDCPTGWREYLNIVTRRTLQVTGESEIVAARYTEKLSDQHLKVLRWFESSNSYWQYRDEKQMLVCHTFDLKRCHKALNLVGIFETLSTGKDQGHDQNCYAFPCTDGAWIIRRHTRGVTEHSSWFKDTGGWTTSYYNRRPNFKISAKSIGGIETDKGFNFDSRGHAAESLRNLNIDLKIPLGMNNRPTSIEQMKDGKLKITIPLAEHDEPPDGWVKKKKNWEKIVYNENTIEDIELPDNLLRHITTDLAEYGWFIQTRKNWVQECKSNIVSVMISRGFKRDRIDCILGLAVTNHWVLVNKPFQPEYPGNREWNKYGAQFRFEPKEGDHPTWDRIFKHIGESLNETLKTNKWAQYTRNINGELYLRAWCAALFQTPTEPLPYLFLCGGQNTGKSCFHECLSRLFTTGYCRADRALTNQSGFNGEVANAVLCIIEETNLSKKGPASDRIKDWVTGKTISIRDLYRTSYEMPNHTHWIQCANSREYCPILPGDTRITVLTVGKIESEIPKQQILELCEKEAPAFLYTLLNFELPKPDGRLAIPVIETIDKLDIMEDNRDSLEVFIDECVYVAPGYKVLLNEFYTRFDAWLSPQEKPLWNSRRLGKAIQYPKGRAGGNGNVFIGNISFTKPKDKLPLLRRDGRRLL